MKAALQPALDKTVARAKERIVAFDLLRGFFLMVVIIDHVELFPSGYELLTGRGQLWVSAAEGFFFLSGLLIGFIYRKKLAEGMAFVFRKLWSRALLLYVIAVSLTLIYTAWALAHGNPAAIKDGAASALDWQTVWNALRLDYVYGWGDFLSYYVTFLLAAPFVLYMLKYGWWWLVAILSAVIWFNRGLEFTWAWQVLFCGGIVAGYYWRNLQAWVESWPQRVRRLTWRWVVGAALTAIAVSFANRFVLEALRKSIAVLPAWLADFTAGWYALSESIWPYFDKFTLEPGRMLMFLLWFAGGFLLVQRYAHKLPKRLFNVFTLLGQNSLYVYGMHSFLVFAVHAYLPKDAGVVFNFAITSLVLAIMVGITYAKVWYMRLPAGERLKPAAWWRMVRRALRPLPGGRGA